MSSVLSNPEAEKAVVGSLLIDPFCIERIKGMLSPRDFAVDEYRWVYEVALSLASTGTPVDYVTVITALRNNGKADLLSEQVDHFLVGLVEELPSSAYVEHYAEIVARTARDRAVVEFAGEVVRGVYADADGNGIERAENLLREIARDRHSLRGNMRSMTEIVRSMLDHAARIEQARHTGTYVDLYTGIPQVDKYIVGGLLPGDVFVLAGQTGSRKSVTAHMAAYYAANVCGLGVLEFSTEMPGEQLAARAAGAKTGVASRMIQSGLLTAAQWEALMRHAPAVECDHYLVEDLVMSSDFLESRVEEAERLLEDQGHPLRLVVVDYLQMIRDPRSRDRRQDIDAVLHGIKRMAKKFPFIVVSSIRRTENLYTKPSLRDALESSFIEFVATYGAVMWRDEQGVYHIEFQKSRDGGTGVETLPPAMPNQAWFDIRQVTPIVQRS